MRRQLGALGGEGVDRDARAGEAAEVEVEVGEVEQRLAEGGDAAGSAAHVDRRLQVPHGGGQVALRLGDGGEVEPRGGDGAGVPRLLGGGERLLVRRLGLVELIVALERERERPERDGADARLARRVREADGGGERGARLGVARGQALGEAAHGDELGEGAAQRRGEGLGGALLLSVRRREGDADALDGVGRAALGLGVVAAAQVGPRVREVEARRELAAVVGDEVLDAAELGEGARGVAAVGVEASAGDRDLRAKGRHRTGPAPGPPRRSGRGRAGAGDRRGR